MILVVLVICGEVSLKIKNSDGTEIPLGIKIPSDPTSCPVDVAGISLRLLGQGHWCALENTYLFQEFELNNVASQKFSGRPEVVVGSGERSMLCAKLT